MAPKILILHKFNFCFKKLNLYMTGIFAQHPNRMEQVNQANRCVDECIAFTEGLIGVHGDFFALIAKRAMERVLRQRELPTAISSLVFDHTSAPASASAPTHLTGSASYDTESRTIRISSQVTQFDPPTPAEQAALAELIEFYTAATQAHPHLRMETFYRAIFPRHLFAAAGDHPMIFDMTPERT